MAIIAVEKNGSRRFISDPGNSSIEFLYSVSGTSSETSINSYMLQHHVAPYPISPWFEFTYRNMDIEPVWVDSANDEGLWDVTIRYGAQEALVPDELLSFDTAGGMQHVTQSKNTVRAYGRPSYQYKQGKNTITVPGIEAKKTDNWGAIGVNSDAVDGVDVVVPVYNFTISKRFEAEIANSTYRKNLVALTGTVNDFNFKEFEPGEVLFLGANGVTFRDEKQLINGYAKEYWDITFSFAASPNRDDITIGMTEDGEPLIGNIRKRGWEYLWVKYGDSVSPGWLTKQPLAVYVEQVYRYGDFSQLNLT